MRTDCYESRGKSGHPQSVMIVVFVLRLRNAGSFLLTTDLKPKHLCMADKSQSATETISL